VTDPFPELSPSDLFADVRRVGVIRREGRQRERVRRDVVNTIGEYEASYPPFLWAPPPVIIGVEPLSANIGETVTVTVVGTGFVLASTVHAAGAPLPTSYVSDTQLTATYTAPPAVGFVAFTVVNPGRVSNAVSFEVIDVFSPDEIPGLYGWFEADNVANFIYSSGLEISEWINKGSGVNFQQPVIGIQPAHQPAGYGRIWFDASVGDCLENLEFMWPANPGNPSNRPYTEYVALYPYGPSYGQVHSSPYIDRNYLAADTVTWRYLVGGGSVSFPVGVAPVDQRPQLFTFVVGVDGAPGSLKAYRDGVLVGQGTNSGWSIDNGLRIGGRMDGGEIWRSFFYAYNAFLVYEGVHDDATRLQIEDYLRVKYGLP
jgi:hypothetical protein